MAKSFAKLTRPALRTLTPGGKIIEHGISFERSANGDGVYSVNIMVDGQRIHRVIGRESDGTTRTQAEEFIESTRIQAKEARLNLPKGRKTVLGFRAAADQYLDRLKQEGGRALTTKRQHLQLHLMPFFADKPLSQITSFDIERYKKLRLSEAILPKGKARPTKPAPDSTKSAVPNLTKPGTINRELATLSHLINKSVEWHWIDRRPARLRRLAENNRRTVYLTAPQAQAVLEAAKSDSCVHIYPFVLIGLHTAMRRSEILCLRRQHIDLEKLTIYIPQAKAGARNQPITADLAAYLDSHIADLPKDWDFLFPSKMAKSGHVTDVAKAFRRVVTAAGIDHKLVTPHTLRHTAITHLVQAGVDLPTVKRISGHKTLIMVERYAQQSGAHISAAMDKLGARYQIAKKSA